MTRNAFRAALGLALSALLAGACTAKVSEPGAGEEGEEEVVTSTSATSSGTGSQTGTSCGAEPEHAAVPFESFTSDCGGFPETAGEGDDPAPAYCDAEVLHWSYDAATASLELIDTRIELNCCGDHDVSLAQVGETYVVTETDAPEGDGGRCFCSCVFDFGLSAENVPAGMMDLQIVRHVTDEGAPQVIFEGTLDLDEVSGWEIIDDTPALFCGEPEVS